MYECEGICLCIGEASTLRCVHECKCEYKCVYTYMDKRDIHICTHMCTHVSHVHVNPTICVIVYFMQPYGYMCMFMCAYNVCIIRVHEHICTVAMCLFMYEFVSMTMCLLAL